MHSLFETSQNCSNLRFWVASIQMDKRRGEGVTLGGCNRIQSQREQRSCRDVGPFWSTAQVFLPDTAFIILSTIPYLI